LPLLADGAGVVAETGASSLTQKWKGKRVVLNPRSVWHDDPDGPEDAQGYKILEGTKANPAGTLVITLLLMSMKSKKHQHISMMLKLQVFPSLD
jgi:hypothetical protein